jgi:mono/diheme cytochrome c family protein
MLRFLDRGLEIVCAAAVVLFVVALVAGPGAIGAKKETPQPPPGKAATSGAQVFASAGCGSCHTLKAAHATGSVGPNLDQLKPDATTVAAIVRSGGGTMPSFDGKLNAAQIAAVARYVSSAAGG